MASKCPKCGKDIRDQEAIYCPYCSEPLKELPRKKTGFPIAGGVLAIIAASASIILGIIGFVAFIDSLSYYYYGPQYGFLFVGIFGIVAFALGLTCGIMSLRRKNFVLSIVGISHIIASGFVNIIGFSIVRYGSIWIGLLFGVPVIVLSILSVIFAAIPKKEFS